MKPIPAILVAATTSLPSSECEKLVFHASAKGVDKYVVDLRSAEGRNIGIKGAGIQRIKKIKMDIPNSGNYDHLDRNRILLSNLKYLFPITVKKLDIRENRHGHALL